MLIRLSAAPNRVKVRNEKHLQEKHVQVCLAVNRNVCSFSKEEKGEAVMGQRASTFNKNQTAKKGGRERNKK